MAKLDDIHGKITALLDEISRTNLAYASARTLLSELEGDADVNLSELGMSLRLGEVSIPIPVPTDRESLIGQVADAAGFLGNEIVRLWNELHTTSSEAKQHCDAAAQAVQAPPAEAPQTQPVAPQPVAPQPAAPQVIGPQPGVIPQQPAGAQPVQPQVAPRVNAIVTTPVGPGS